MSDTIAKYEIIDTLGKGPAGAVHKALDTRLKRVVTLRVLAASRAGEDAAEALHARARECAALAHPGLVTVLDLDRDGDQAFVALEHADGVSLDAVAEGRVALGLEDKLAALADAAAALAYAHSRGVVHAGIRPSSFVRQHDGKTRLVDLVVARPLPAAASDPAATPRAATPFVSPEQLSGRPDARSDQYSLAAAFHAVLTGEPAFAAEDGERLAVAIAGGKRRELLDAAPGLPAELAALFARAMEKEPASRFPGMDEFAAALQGAVAALETEKRRLAPRLAPLLEEAADLEAQLARRLGRPAPEAPARLVEPPSRFDELSARVREADARIDGLRDRMARVEGCQLHLQRGAQLLQEKKFREARAELETVFEQVPDYDAARPLLEQARAGEESQRGPLLTRQLLDEARATLDAGDADATEALLRRVEAIPPPPGTEAEITFLRSAARTLALRQRQQAEARQMASAAAARAAEAEAAAVDEGAAVHADDECARAREAAKRADALATENRFDEAARAWNETTEAWRKAAREARHRRSLAPRSLAATADEPAAAKQDDAPRQSAAEPARPDAAPAPTDAVSTKPDNAPAKSDPAPAKPDATPAPATGAKPAALPPSSGPAPVDAARARAERARDTADEVRGNLARLDAATRVPEAWNAAEAMTREAAAALLRSDFDIAFSAFEAAISLWARCEDALRLEPARSRHDRPTPPAEPAATLPPTQPASASTAASSPSASPTPASPTSPPPAPTSAPTSTAQPGAAPASAATAAAAASATTPSAAAASTGAASAAAGEQPPAVSFTARPAPPPPDRGAPPLPEARDDESSGSNFLLIVLVVVALFAVGLALWPSLTGLAGKAPPAGVAAVESPGAGSAPSPTGAPVASLDEGARLEAAQAARDRASAARREAEAAEAPRLVPDVHRSALVLEAEAGDAFARRDYAGAARLFGEARSDFDEARALAAAKLAEAAGAVVRAQAEAEEKTRLDAEAKARVEAEEAKRAAEDARRTAEEKAARERIEAEAARARAEAEAAKARADAAAAKMKAEADAAAAKKKEAEEAEKKKAEAEAKKKVEAEAAARKKAEADAAKPAEGTGDAAAATEAASSAPATSKPSFQNAWAAVYSEPTDGRKGGGGWGACWRADLASARACAKEGCQKQASSGQGCVESASGEPGEHCAVARASGFGVSWGACARDRAAAETAAVAGCAASVAKRYEGAQASCSVVWSSARTE